VKAMVVDDARSMRLVVGNWLKDCEFDVIEAQNGRDAWQIFEASGPVDLAVVDWNMPLMTGHELIVKLRADAKFKSMKILMISTEGSEEQINRALNSGANAYLAKPVTEDALREKLRLLGFPG